MSRSQHEKDFKRFTKQVMKEYRIWQQGKLDWYWYLGLVASVLGIGGSIAAFLTSYGFIIFTLTITIIFVLSLIALFVSGCFYVSARKKSRDAKGYEFIHLSVHRLRDSFSQLDKSNFSNEKDFVFFLQMTARTVLTCLSHGFSILTGSRCRVCIKVIDVPGPARTKEDVVARGRVKTFCRDEVSAAIVDQMGMTNEPIKLAENARYRAMLLDPDRNQFYCSNVKKAIDDGSYESSNYNSQNCPCYESILILPIRVKHSKPGEPSTGYIGQDGAQTEEQTLIGFLVIDSDCAAMLGQLRDHHAGAIVADALFIFLNLAFELIPANGEPNWGIKDNTPKLISNNN